MNLGPDAQAAGRVQSCFARVSKLDLQQQLELGAISRFAYIVQLQINPKTGILQHGFRLKILKLQHIWPISSAAMS